MERKHCLYSIKTKDMEYTGVTEDPIQREDTHLWGDDRKGRTMRKYGYSFKILVRDLTYEEAYKLEELLVNEKYLSNPLVLNMTLGGVGSFRHIHDAWKNGTLSPPGMTDACLKGRLDFNDTPEGKESMKKQGEWLANSYGKRVLERAGHQRMAVKARWDNVPEGWEHSTKGKKYKGEEHKKLYPKATCPKCGKEGNARGIKQWHGLDGSKCKKSNQTE